MSDIGMDVSGIIAVFGLTVAATVLILVAFVLLARALWRRASGPRLPLLTEKAFQHALGARVAALVMALVTNGNVLSHRSRVLCDELFWLWLFIVVIVWWGTEFTCRSLASELL